MFRLLVLLASILSGLCAAAAEPVRLVAYGDSLTAGFGLAPGEDFASVLEAALQARGHEVEVRNAGVSGDTASAGLARLDWTLSGAVDGVILELGANDMLRGIDPATTEDALEAVIEELDARGVEVLLAGMLASPNLGADYGNRFNAIYPDLARRHDLLLYPFFLDGVAADPTLNLDDGMHPNAAGVAVIVDRILPSVEALLDRIEAGG